METTATSMTPNQVAPTAQPRFSGMSHVSVPCRDLAVSKLFYSQVMGGALVHEIAGFVEYRIEDIIFGLSEQAGGWTGADDEYPHYAFYIDGPNYELMKSWLDRHGVPNYPYRRGETALIYFRDPSGNLFELYCDKGYDRLASLPLAPRRGGQAIDFRALNYRWNGKDAALNTGKNPPRPRFTAFAHASIFCGDLEQAKRFFTKVIGGELIHDVDGFAEVRVAGVIIGLTIAWLRQNGVTTSEPWTRDGVKGLLYFRDPSGNLFEMYCPKLKEAASFARGAKQIGSYTVDLAGLNYRWNG